MFGCSLTFLACSSSSNCSNVCILPFIFRLLYISFDSCVCSLANLHKFHQILSLLLYFLDVVLVDAPLSLIVFLRISAFMFVVLTSISIGLLKPPLSYTCRFHCLSPSTSVKFIPLNTSFTLTTSCSSFSFFSYSTPCKTTFLFFISLSHLFLPCITEENRNFEDEYT